MSIGPSTDVTFDPCHIAGAAQQAQRKWPQVIKGSDRDVHRSTLFSSPGTGSSQQGGRLPELDALRGCAAFVVLVHHALFMSGVLDVRSDGAFSERILHTLLHFSPLQVLLNGRAPVLFFFVLSGYVLTSALLRQGSPGFRAFAVQRTVRLYLPVAFSVLVSFAICSVAAERDPCFGDQPLCIGEPGAWQVLRQAALLGTDRHGVPVLNPVLWSLVHEWRLTVFMPLVLLFVGAPWMVMALAFVGMALGLLGGATENMVHLGPRLHSSIAATLYFTPGIASGAALALLGPLPRLTRQQRLAAGVTALALFGLRSDLAFYLASVLVLVLAMQPGRARALLRKSPLTWLGRISFSLYLLHVPLLIAVTLALEGWVHPGIALGLGVILALPAAALMHRFVERPSRNLSVWLERRLERPRAALDSVSA